jgi:hypothetical protein
MGSVKESVAHTPDIQIIRKTHKYPELYEQIRF